MESITLRSGKAVSVELETPATQLQITPRTIKLSLTDNDLRAQLCIVMMKHPGEAWTLSALMTGLEQHGWGTARPNVVKALRELVGLGLVEIVQSGTRADYRLLKDKIHIPERNPVAIQ